MSRTRRTAAFLSTARYLPSRRVRSSVIVAMTASYPVSLHMDMKRARSEPRAAANAASRMPGMGAPVTPPQDGWSAGPLLTTTGSGGPAMTAT
jgi:hypothetical protein